MVRNGLNQYHASQRNPLAVRSVNMRIYDGLLAGRPEFKLPGHIAGNPTDAVSLDEDGARVPLVIGIGNSEDDAMRFHIPVPILSVLAGKGAGPIRIIRRRRGKQRVARRDRSISRVLAISQSRPNSRLTLSTNPVADATSHGNYPT